MTRRSFSGGFVLLAGTALLLAGCVVDGPLSDPRTDEADTRLLGRWSTSAGAVADANEPDLKVVRHSVAGNPRHLLEVHPVDMPAKSAPADSQPTKPGPDKVFVSTTAAHGMHLVNIYYVGNEFADFSQPGSYETWLRNPKRSCVVYRYELENDRLRLFPAQLKQLNLTYRDGTLQSDFQPATAAEFLDKLRMPGGDAVFAAEYQELVRRKE